MNVFIVGFLRWHGLTGTTLFLKLIEPQGWGGGGGGVSIGLVLFLFVFLMFFLGGVFFSCVFSFFVLFFSLFFRFCCLSVGLVFCCFLVLFLFVLFRVLFFRVCVCVCVVLCFCCCCCLFFCFFVVVFSSFLGVGLERKLAFNAQSTVTVMRERGGVRGFIIASV